ncbi:hypothetical protein [Streptomyces sp. NBC_01296]|uniref:hypothetical protein n=1 Tax=Streptomyces sp. NBC_01296 TaxID=2903816 RepID=UPI002E11526C|nr:hypothetical protein OG299_42430 [Streptomyces sp. NBC_01296]
MGNDWTRLTQEAGERGGPDALRDFYRTQGQKSAVTYMACLAVASCAAYGVNKYRKYAEDKKMDRRISELEAEGSHAETEEWQGEIPTV